MSPSGVNTPQRERKRMLALLIEDVTLVKQRQVTAQVRFRGGATTTLTVPRPLTAWERRATSAETRQHMNALLDEYTDAQVAAVLNERGLRTARGALMGARAVVDPRRPEPQERLTLPACSARRRRPTGVRRTIGRWRREDARRGPEMGQWLYAPHNVDGRPPSETARPKEDFPCRRCSMKDGSSIDVLACPHCGGRLRLIATLHDPAVIRKLLAHLGMARSGPSPGPAPPAPGAAAP
jgi:hypothetical protein